MCLVIGKRRKKIEKDENGDLIGYKVLGTKNGHHTTPYQETRWTWGRKGSSRRTTALSSCEIETKEVLDGIHLFCKLKDAEAAARRKIGWLYNHRYFVVKVTVKPEHFVVSGTFDDCEDSFVATKVTSRREDTVFVHY